MAKKKTNTPAPTEILTSDSHKCELIIQKHRLDANQTLIICTWIDNNKQIVKASTNIVIGLEDEQVEE
jgi:hypothetical protein